MPHTYTDVLIHFIFSTKDRAPLIAAEIREKLIAYLGGIVRELKAAPMAINAVADHLHALIRMPSDLSPAEIMRIVKTNSSRWVHEQWPQQKYFVWQTGMARSA
jgi:putative transposase